MYKIIIKIYANLLMAWYLSGFLDTIAHSIKMWNKDICLDLFIGAYNDTYKTFTRELERLGY